MALSTIFVGDLIAVLFTLMVVVVVVGLFVMVVRSAVTGVWPGHKAAEPPPLDDMVSELERLAQLHESGALTDDEFSRAKQKLLGTFTRHPY